MEPILISHEIHKTNFLTRLTLILLGIFATSSIFAITVNALDSIGILLGFLICAALIFCGLRFKKPGSYLRIITWSMLVTVVLVTAMYFVFLISFQNAMQGFQTK